jgi:hypothetical protein
MREDVVPLPRQSRVQTPTRREIISEAHFHSGRDERHELPPAQSPRPYLRTVSVAGSFSNDSSGLAASAGRGFARSEVNDLSVSLTSTALASSTIRGRQPEAVSGLKPLVFGISGWRAVSLASC